MTDVVYIVKMNENILQKDYYLTIDVIHDFGIYTAVLSKFKAYSDYSNNRNINFMCFCR